MASQMEMPMPDISRSQSEMDVEIKADADLLNQLRMSPPAPMQGARPADDFLIFPR